MPRPTTSAMEDDKGGTTSCSSAVPGAAFTVAGVFFFTMYTMRSMYIFIWVSPRPRVRFDLGPAFPARRSGCVCLSWPALGWVGPCACRSSRRARSSPWEKKNTSGCTDTAFLHINTLEMRLLHRSVDLVRISICVGLRQAHSQIPSLRIGRCRWRVRPLCRLHECGPLERCSSALLPECITHAPDA
jgi:hypothetical protein